MYRLARAREMGVVMGVLALCASVAPVWAADKVVFIQPIQVRDNDGANPANSAMQLLEDATDKILAQANVEV